MTINVIMPKLGMSMREGTVVAWYVEEQACLRKGQAIAEVESEKTTFTIESPDDGVLAKILLLAGNCCAVGEPIAIIETVGAQSTTDGTTEGSRTPNPVVAATLLQATIASATNPSIPAALPADEGVHHVMSSATDKFAIDADDNQLVPLTSMRRAIATRMQASAQTIPQVTLFARAAASGLIRARAEHRPAIDESGALLTFDDLIIYFVARALVKHRQLNASFEPDGIRYYSRAHIGFAVAIDDGLVVPVVRDAHELPLIQIARRTSELAEKARARRLAPADMEAGTFTISNLGKYSVDHFTALINIPQAGILSIGQIRKEAVVLGDTIVATEMVGLGLTFDHRVADGAVAAQFLSLLIGDMQKAVVC